MKIKRVGSAAEFFGALEKDRDAYGLQTIGHVNWPDEFLAKPDVKFAIAHTGSGRTACSEILLKFFVSEDYTLARVTEDNGEVWTDSCVEFFINFDETGYYNLECTCIGKCLLGFRKEKAVFTHASQNILDTIVRRPSLGTQPFSEKRDQVWTLEIVLPATAFFKHDIADLSGMKAHGNFYKCGDSLTVPHFLSWNPIDNPAPNFHLEKFFGEID